MTTTTNALRVAQVIRADREKLFRAWTDPAEPVHWWRMEEKGWAFAGATIDLRVGGRYRLGMTSPEGKTHVAVGEYGVLDRPKRLAFTWDWAIRKARWVRRSSPWSSTMPVRVPPIARPRHAGDRRMTTGDVIRGYFSALERKNGWESHLANDLAFTSHTSPVS